MSEHSSVSSSRRSNQNAVQPKVTYSFRTHRIMTILEDSTIMQSASIAKVYLAPPDPHELTDEDSGDEDFGGTFDNLSRAQLQSEAEAVVDLFQETDAIRIDENNINNIQQDIEHTLADSDSEEQTEDVDSFQELDSTKENTEGVLVKATVQQTNNINDAQSTAGLETKEIHRKRKLVNKSAKTLRNWILSDIPVDNSLRSCLLQKKLEWNIFLPSFYSRPLTPLQIFQFFFSDELLTHIVKETVRYAFQKGFRLELGVDELKAFLGILLVSGYNVNPRRRMYWEESDDARNLLITNSMRRNRFETIMRFLHFNDNQKLDRTDKTYKLLPYIETLKKYFFEFTIWESESSIDEAMIPYYGRHGMKQHIKGKPIRFGYKSWCWNMKSGYLIDFQVYQGAKGKENKYKEEYGLGGSIILHFADLIPKKSDDEYIPHTLYADNYFTSLKLIDGLTEKGIGYVGTLRSNRVEKCPLTEITKKSTRGRYEICYDKKNNVLVCRWNDNSIVTLASNCQGANPTYQASRYSFTENQKIKVVQPNMVKNYNENMGGTDRMDQNVSYYRTSIRSKKWYWPLFIWGLDVSVQNAWLIYRRMRSEVPNQPDMDLLEFRRNIAKGLLTRYGTPPTRPGPTQLIRKRTTQDARYDNVGHLIVSQTKRTRCAMCSSTTIKKCIKCNIALHEKCFVRYHTE